MVSFINVGLAAKPPLPILPFYDSTAASVNQGLIVTLRQ
jgi:hypothetical protein